MRKNVRAAMDALFSGNDYTNTSIQTRQHGEWGRPDDNHPMPTVYSYGSHFPIVMLGSYPHHDEAYVNTARYSATTSTQQSGVAIYLHYEGYRDTGETIAHRDHTYRVYRKTDAESWPTYALSPRSVFARPAHHRTGA